MKLKNKKTGEIGRLITHDWLEDSLILSDDDGVQLAKYTSLSELNDEWEDYEEPKNFWYIDNECGVMCESTDSSLWDKKYAIEFMKQIGNYLPSF